MNTAETKHTKFNNVAEYTLAREMNNANELAARAWMKANKTNAIPVEISNTFPFSEMVTNELRSSIEEWEFFNNKPEKYFLYINTKRHEATTWTGQKLGNISFGHEYRSNMGDRRVPVSITALNGIKYHGIFYKSSGDYARITKSKQ